MPNDDRQRSRAIRRTALGLWLLATGFYLAFIVWTWMQ